MGELAMVPLVHASNVVLHEAIWRLGKIARALPDLTIIAIEPFFTYDGMQGVLLHRRRGAERGVRDRVVLRQPTSCSIWPHSSAPNAWSTAVSTTRRYMRPDTSVPTNGAAPRFATTSSRRRRSPTVRSTRSGRDRAQDPGL
jgi:hypothetical protein